VHRVLVLGLEHLITNTNLPRAPVGHNTSRYTSGLHGRKHMHVFAIFHDRQSLAVADGAVTSGLSQIDDILRRRSACNLSGWVVTSSRGLAVDWGFWSRGGPRLGFPSFFRLYGSL
jgi:hypothetical protein